MNAETSLYRHFASDGSLLYVGISLAWPARTRSHAHQSRWFDLVARVEIERFPCREEALMAEREAIKAERPRFNVIHNQQGRTPKAASKLHRPQRFADPLLNLVRGPHAIVGPALIYRGDTISVIVAHGELGTEGHLTELVLGEHFPETPAWADACDTVITIRRADEITIAEAREKRREIIRKLRGCLKEVQTFETDLALATAYAFQFPSKKSRQVLDEVAIERARAA